MAPRLSSLDEREYPDSYPPEGYFKPYWEVTQPELAEFQKVLDTGSSETETDEFLGAHPSIISAVLGFTMTGGHGGWVIPQQNVRPPQAARVHGLRPDYIIGGKNSDGFSWFVVELKGPADSVFVEKDGRLAFSATAHRGVFQLLEYIDYCTEAQNYLRDQLKLTDFREPKGYLIMGREREFEDDEHRRRMKAAWNRAVGGKLEIRSYDALLRESKNRRGRAHEE
jgi:hypothetical protein